MNSKIFRLLFNMMRCCSLLLIPSLVAGCGGRAEEAAIQGVEVSGFVAVDGQPLPEGSVSFIPVNGARGPTASATIIAGVFSVPVNRGLLPGSYRLEIQAANPQAPDPDDEGAALKYQQDLDAGKIKKIRLPAKFNTSSQLMEHIPAATHHDITLELLTN